VTSLLDELGHPYMLIGGLAVAMWGEPRNTLDVDVSVWVEPESLDSAVARIAARLATIPNPVEFVRRTRVLPATTSQNTRADIVFAALDAERTMIERAQWKAVGPARVRVATVEDLVIMKLISERAKDNEDARKLIHRCRRDLDRAYLEPRLQELATALDRPDIVGVYRELAMPQ